jgi:hypothetical protein
MLTLARIDVPGQCRLVECGHLQYPVQGVMLVGKHVPGADLVTNDDMCAKATVVAQAAHVFKLAVSHCSASCRSRKTPTVTVPRPSVA